MNEETLKRAEQAKYLIGYSYADSAEHKEGFINGAMDYLVGRQMPIKGVNLISEWVEAFAPDSVSDTWFYPTELSLPYLLDENKQPLFPELQPHKADAPIEFQTPEPKSEADELADIEQRLRDLGQTGLANEVKKLIKFKIGGVYAFTDDPLSDMTFIRYGVLSRISMDQEYPYGQRVGEDDWTNFRHCYTLEEVEHWLLSLKALQP